MKKSYGIYLVLWSFKLAYSETYSFYSNLSDKVVSGKKQLLGSDNTCEKESRALLWIRSISRFGTRAKRTTAEGTKEGEVKE